MAQPTLDTYTVPDPTTWQIIRLNGEVASTSLNGTYRSDILYRKYQYILQYSFMTKTEFEVMQNNINSFLDNNTTPDFTYDKIATADGVEVIPMLGDATRVNGSDVNYLIQVDLTLTEVNSR